MQTADSPGLRNKDGALVYFVKLISRLARNEMERLRTCD